MIFITTSLYGILWYLWCSWFMQHPLSMFTDHDKCNCRACMHTCMYIINFLPRMHTCAAGVKQSVYLSSVVCCLLSVSIKVGKSQHLSKSRVNNGIKWCKTVKKHLLAVSFLTLGNIQGSYKLCVYVRHAHLVPHAVYCACSSCSTIYRESRQQKKLFMNI